MRTVQRQPDFAAAWLAQKRAGALKLAAVSQAELAAMSDEEALARTEALLDMVDGAQLPERRLRYSGLVEQQRRFHRARR
jgi:hypothetical protein